RRPAPHAARRARHGAPACGGAAARQDGLSHAARDLARDPALAGVRARSHPADRARALRLRRAQGARGVRGHAPHAEDVLVPARARRPRRAPDRRTRMSDRRFRLTAGLFLAALVLVAWGPSLRAGFLNYDDPQMILENPRLQAPGASDVLRVFTETREFA